jgi:peptidoglycan/LPS O-acetylase OafA/YrhL
VNAPAATERRLAGFDGLRAVAALAIVALHVTSATGAVGATSLGKYFARLDVGVAIFFVISAFLLYRPYVTAHLGGRPALPLRAYWWRRVLRIFPAYWVALTAAILLFRTTALHGFWDYARHYLLVQIYVPKYGLAGIVPTWTLAVELSFYAALPVYAWVLSRLTRGRPAGRRVTIEIGGAVALYAFGLAWHLAVVSTRSTDAVSARWLPAMSDWFALGILLAVLQRSAHASPRIDGLRTFVDRFGDLVVAGALVAFIVVCNIGLPVDGTSGTVRQDMVREILFGLVAALLIAPAALGRTHRGVAMRVLDCRPAVLLGTISYGIFLWHYEWIAQLEKWGGFDWIRSARTLTVFVLVLGLTLVTATASWLLVERPLLRRKDLVRAAPGAPPVSDVRVPEEADLHQQQHHGAPHGEPAGAVAELGPDGSQPSR